MQVKTVTFNAVILCFSPVIESRRRVGTDPRKLAQGSKGSAVIVVKRYGRNDNPNEREAWLESLSIAEDTKQKSDRATAVTRRKTKRNTVSFRGRIVEFSHGGRWFMN